MSFSALWSSSSGNQPKTNYKLSKMVISRPFLSWSAMWSVTSSMKTLSSLFCTLNIPSQIPTYSINTSVSSFGPCSKPTFRLFARKRSWRSSKMPLRKTLHIIPAKSAWMRWSMSFKDCKEAHWLAVKSTSKSHQTSSKDRLRNSTASGKKRRLKGISSLSSKILSKTQRFTTHIRSTNCADCFAWSFLPVSSLSWWA